MCLRFIHFGMAIGLIISASAVLQGQDAEAAQRQADWPSRMRRILEVSGEPWKTQQQKADAYKELASLKPKIDDDPRLFFSFALVAMAEQQWPSAEKLNGELVERCPDYVPARVAFARLLLRADKKLPALAELEALTKALRSPSSEVTEEQLAAASSFLGLAVGYLEGPASETLKPTALQPLIAAVDNIPEPLKEPYSQAKSAIEEEYRVLVESGEDALKKLREGLSQETERMRAELESQRSKVLEDAEDAKRKLLESFAQSKSSWDAAMIQCQSHSRSAESLQLHLGQVVHNLSQLIPPKADKNGRVDYNEERRFRDDRRRLENSYRSLDTQLNNAYLQYNINYRKGLLAENQMNALRIQSKKLGLELASQGGSFAKMDRLIKGKEKKAQQAKPSMTGAKLQRARAFATYDDFNFHKERSMLMDSLAK